MNVADRHGAGRGPIVPPAAIGMLGGGQLGRYALIAARIMGYRTMVLDPSASAPAGAIADEHLIAPYDDPAAVERLGRACAVVTTEFENPPASTLEALTAVTRVSPNADAVAVAQDRRLEKRFLVDHEIPVGPFTVVESQADLATVAGRVGFPAVLKTARLGYDGKGQQHVRSGDDLPDAWRRLGCVPCVLEQRLDLTAEVSTVVARGADGEIAAFDVAENHHVDGILDLTVVPARVDARVAANAVSIARQIAERLHYVGTLAVEFFVVDGHLCVNELAPRPHNSGHWTLDASATDQFTQQIRAVAGLPLGSPVMTAPAAAMVNLLGDRWAEGEPDWAAALAHPRVRLHLYGKHEARPGRKMGHLTATASTPDEAEAVALAARDAASRRRSGDD